MRQSCRQRWDVGQFECGNPTVRRGGSIGDLIPVLAYLDEGHRGSDRTKRNWGLVMRRGLVEEIYICSELCVEPRTTQLKTLHKTIKKVTEDIENFSFNTSVSTFMIAVNELTAQRCISKTILEPLLILISPYAPHIAEELWEQLGHENSITTAEFPEFDASHLIESTKAYPISFNGKMRFTIELSLDLSKEEIEAAVMGDEKTVAQLDGRVPKKVIVVPGKIVNIVG